VFAIGNIEFATRGIETQLQFPTFQDRAVVVVQHRDQYFSIKFIFQRMPVDVEKAGVDGRFAIFEHIEPPGIVATHHTHVVGHDVENQSHAVQVEGIDKAVEVFRAADFRVQRVVVHDIVSVHTSGTSFQTRRDIAVTDAKCSKVRNDGRSLGKREIAIELQAIGGARDFRIRIHDSRNHTTDQGGKVPRFRASAFISSLA